MEEMRANAFLRDFEGTVQTDGYSGYDFLDTRDKIRHIGCWAQPGGSLTM